MIISVQGSTWVEQLLSATVIYQEFFIWLPLQGTEALVRDFVLLLDSQTIPNIINII